MKKEFYFCIIGGITFFILYMIITQDTYSGDCLKNKVVQPILILASSSPSRCRLLSSLNLSFYIFSPDINEDSFLGELPKNYVQRISLEKAKKVLEFFQNFSEDVSSIHISFIENGEKTILSDSSEKAIKAKDNFQKLFQQHPLILSGDTIVAMGRRILRKAKTPEEAQHQMEMLSGRSHRVYSAVTLYNPNTQQYCQRIATTYVKFKHLEPMEIQQFVDSGQWKNVAVYRLEGFVSRFIRSINGESSTIEGLPMFETYQLLRGNGINLSYFSKNNI